jgi:hypothetical protein
MARRMWKKSFQNWSKGAHPVVDLKRIEEERGGTYHWINPAAVAAVMARENLMAIRRWKRRKAG